MKSIRALAPALLTALCAVTATHAQAADAERGEELAWQHRCMTCHGDTGVSIDERYPHLAGQQAAYIVARLKYFKAETDAAAQLIKARRDARKAGDYFVEAQPKVAFVVRIRG